MNELNKKTILWLSIAAGSLWGLAEAGIGMYMRGTCAYGITGSIMTGGALVFLSFTYEATKKWLFLFIPLAMVIAFKSLDALLLGLPFLHGAIANPCFAMAAEVFALIIIINIIKPKLLHKITGRIAAGALYALLAVNLFPLVKYATGIPACTVAGTQYSLALYHLPIAALVSAIAYPIGALLAGLLTKYLTSNAKISEKALQWALRGVAVAVVAVLVVIRL